MAQSPAIPPQYFIHANHGTWDAYKGHAIYRSTPYLSMAYSTHSHYASTQNLSDTYVQLPSGAYSPLYSPSIASLCSSYDAPPPIPLRPRPMTTATMFARSKSDDNILNSIDALPKAKRLPPPPPPYHKKSVKPPMPPPIEEQPLFNHSTRKCKLFLIEFDLKTIMNLRKKNKSTFFDFICSFNSKVASCNATRYNNLATNERIHEISY